jgi:hypothetical protein
MELDDIFSDNKEPIEQPIEWWQEDKIDQIIELCPYPQWMVDDIINNKPSTKNEANILLNKLWFDHIPRDPKDQLLKMLHLNTLI